MKLRIWWTPQVPCEAFNVDVDSVQEGVKILDTLAFYDQFQLDHNIKPDYANAGGLQMFEDGEWVDWHDEETGADDPCEYLENKGAVQ